MSGDLIRVVLADDHSVVRTGLKAVLRTAKDIDVVGEAANGREAVALAERLKPDVVVMDIAMPQLNGLEATRRIKAERPATKVIIVTVHTEDAYRRAAEDRGADAFLVKKTLMTVLLPTIRRMRGSMSPPNAPRVIGRPRPEPRDCGTTC
jgi:DNA-binding NarL/FixJ family response regulator